MDVVTGRKHVVVLGGGLVGGFIAKQGSREAEWHVTLVDRNRAALEALQKKVLLSTNQADLTDKDVVQSCVASADLVIIALPGAIGYRALEWVLDAGKPVVDISFYPEDPRGLQDVAEARHTLAVVDCGVMPGLGGMLAASFASKLDQPEALKIMVGGLPLRPAEAGPFMYKAPFSPADVIEEYTRPARMRVNGTTVVAQPMSDLELVSYASAGELEAFNTDGLRTLLDTLPIPNMVEKTLRYPGHTAKIEFLRGLGLLDTKPLRIKGESITPLDVTSRVLMKSWEIGPDDDEFTVMSVEVEGIKDGRRLRHRAELYDQTQFDGTLSMARTTGFPALIAAKLILSGKISGVGIIPAETFGLDESLFSAFMGGFLRYGLNVTMMQRDMGAAGDPVTQPLVTMPTQLWEEPQADAPAEVPAPKVYAAITESNLGLLPDAPAPVPAPAAEPVAEAAAATEAVAIAQPRVPPAGFDGQRNGKTPLPLGLGGEEE
jgi:saccharopine dehydrogenase-like NADP-dependent oxidoreductase